MYVRNVLIGTLFTEGYVRSYIGISVQVNINETHAPVKVKVVTYTTCKVRSSQFQSRSLCC